MISVFDIGVNDFTGNGSAVLAPTEGKLKMVAGGACEITMKHPMGEMGELSPKWSHLVPGAIIRVPVPPETIENAFIGIEVDLYRTSQRAALREGPSEPTPITYSEWIYTANYQVGSRVTDTPYGNYQCIAYDSSSPQVMVPPHNNTAWWKKIADQTSGSPVLMMLNSGEDLYFLENAGSGWYKMSTPMGIEGYIKSSQITYIEHIMPEESDERTITEQLFRIKTVTADSEKRELTVYAQHVSYDLSAILIRDVTCSQLSPSMTINRIEDGLMMEYRGSIATNLTSDENGTFTGSFNGKNGIFAFLDPGSGIVPTFDARFTRDNWDLFILKKTDRDRGCRIAYGKNAKGITWKRSSENLVTRVVPVAKAQDGKDLYLPEEYIDSENIDDYPVIMMERLAVKGQVGKDDGTGTDTNWTESTLYDEMRAKAEERFTVDHADEIYAEVTVDFEQLGDTDEYAWLKSLEQVLLYDTVHAEDAQMGLSIAMTVTELEWDFIRRKITAVKVSTAIDHGLETVAGYNIGNNTIGSEKLTEAAITEIAGLLT